MFSQALRALSPSSGLLGGGVICVLNVYIVILLLNSLVEYAQIF
jgi:hypothetical protein